MGRRRARRAARARRLEAGPLSRPGRALARAGSGLSRTGRDGAGRERAGDGAGVVRSLCRAEPASGRAAGGGLGRITDQTEARAEDRVRRVDGGGARARRGWPGEPRRGERRARLTRARPTRRRVTLVERAAAEEEEAREEEEPAGDSTALCALCGEGGSVL